MRKRRRKKKSFLKRFIMTLLSLAIIVFGGYVVSENVDIEITLGNDTIIDLDSIPDYEEDPYIEINDNIPYFTDDEITTDVFEEYSELDNLGRCGVAYANICQDLMPTEKKTVYWYD